MHFNIAILPILGYFQVNISSKGIQVTGGYEAKLLRILSQTLKFTYTIKIPHDLEWGRRKENNNWTGLIGMVQRGEADMAISQLGMNEDRMAIVHFSYPYYIEEVTFAKRLPGFASKTTAFMRPFTTNLWIALCAYLAVSPFVFRQLLKSKVGMTKWILSVFSCLLRQSTGIRAKFTSDQVLLSCIYISSFFITCSYISILLSFLTLPFKERDIRDIKELSKAVQLGSIRCSTIKGGATYDNLLNSKDDAVKIITSSFTETDLIEAEKEAVKSFIEEKEGALISTKEAIRVLIPNVFLSSDNFFNSMSGIVVGKKFLMKRKLDTAIQRIWSSGIPKKILEDYLWSPQNLPTKAAEKLPLTMNNLRGAFLILLFGHIIALISFLLELVYHHIQFI